MHKVVVIGAGKIGSLISLLLLESGDYHVSLVDQTFDFVSHIDYARYGERFKQVELNIEDQKACADFLDANAHDALISCLPFFHNKHVIELARSFNLHYFDLTEDTAVSELVRETAQGADSAFVPQCGLAPGFIGIVANSLMKDFDELDIVKLRVGALPVSSSNVLQYSLTWSTDGLINEYGNLCYGIENGKLTVLHPLEGVEFIQIDGLMYEAFNTSGGLGALAEIYQGKVNTLNYKTIRYPGHRNKMYFLMNDLRLNEDRDTLKRILENAVPKTHQDVVLVYASVSGNKNASYLEKHYVNKVYPKTIGGHQWSAIQVTTAAGLCTLADIVLAAPDQYQGFVQQELLPLDTFLQNRFGKLYQSEQ